MKSLCLRRRWALKTQNLRRSTIPSGTCKAWALALWSTSTRLIK
jgi:hypothetical protein